MPRKQRFKPSRKLKAVGTLTDLEPVDQEAQVPVPIRPKDAGNGVVEGIIERGRQDTDVYSRMNDLGGEG
jgi:hypothetical protein